MKNKMFKIAIIIILIIIVGLWIGGIIPKQIAKINGNNYMQKHFPKMQLKYIDVEWSKFHRDYIITFKDKDNKTYGCTIGPKYFPITLGQGLFEIEETYRENYENDNKLTLNPVEVNDYIINYFYFKNNANSNLSYNYVDTEKDKVIVGLLNNSKEKQEEFINEVFSHCCGSIYIKNLKEQNIIIFEQGEQLIDTIDNDRIIVDVEPSPLSSFDLYLERDGIIIYKIPYIKEIYYNETNKKVTLKDYITNTNQTTEDSIKKFTDLLDNVGMLKDGGTKIYKSKSYNITLVKCNTVDGSKDVFIGTYETNFNSEIMCKR